MESALNRLRARELALQDQIAAWQKLALSASASKILAEENRTERDLLSPIWEKLRRLYLEDFPIANLRDTSDLIIHADGPGTHLHAPQLRSVNWIGKTVRTQLTKMAAAALPVADDASLHLARQAQWGVTGLVPGSIFMGFALERPTSRVGFEAGDQQTFDIIREAARSISTVPRFVQEDGVHQDLVEAISDPAVRDAAMMAAMQLSPTKSSAFDTIEISAPGRDVGVLHLRERLALKSALSKPMMRRKQKGTFVGFLNEVDLDSSRFQLRSVPGVGTLRCVMEFTRDHARQWLGHMVEAQGVYDTDTSGRPRLMRVEKVLVRGEQLPLG